MFVRSMKSIVEISVFEHDLLEDRKQNSLYDLSDHRYAHSLLECTARENASILLANPNSIEYIEQFSKNLDRMFPRVFSLIDDTLLKMKTRIFILEQEDLTMIIR